MTPPAFHDLRSPRYRKLHCLPHESARILRESGLPQMRTLLALFLSLTAAGAATGSTGDSPTPAKPAPSPGRGRGKESGSEARGIARSHASRRAAYQRQYRLRLPLAQRRGRQFQRLPQRRQPGRRSQAARLGFLHRRSEEEILRPHRHAGHRLGRGTRTARPASTLAKWASTTCASTTAISPTSTTCRLMPIR